MDSKLTLPTHLYKILSMDNWHASQGVQAVVLSQDDASFIHFATEEQLQKIVEKYWSDAQQFVILKVDPNQVSGKWAYETNPGGATKYYHLYNGSIPMQAVLEVKKVENQKLPQAGQLRVVHIGDPVLRQVARELTTDEILSDEIQDLIKKMIVTMRAAPGVGVAAPQVGHSLQLIVIEDADQSFLTAQQIEEFQRFPVALHVLINPRLFVQEDSQKLSFFEGCLSVPLRGVVPRASSVRVEALNERAEPVVIEAKGWYARILQHEIDHLNGRLCIDCALPRTLTTEENYMKLWRGKGVKEALTILND